MSEYTAIVTVAATGRGRLEVGTIVAANDAASGTFGDGVVGRDLSAVVLPPISISFSGIVCRYLEVGEVDYFHELTEVILDNGTKRLMPF